jgi:transcriptional regulator with XRE-family HTH domain
MWTRIFVGSLFSSVATAKVFLLGMTGMQLNQHDESLQRECLRVNSIDAVSVGIPTECVASLLGRRINVGMHFGERLRKLLGERGRSQVALAQAIGTNQQQISRWVDAEHPPKAEYLLKIAEYFNVTTDYLYGVGERLTPGAEILTDDERYVLRSFRAFGISADEAIRRMAGQIAVDAVEQPAKPAAEQPPRKGKTG